VLPLVASTMETGTAEFRRVRSLRTTSAWLAYLLRSALGIRLSPMRPNRRQLRVIAELYDAAIDAGSWSQVLDKLAVEFGEKSSVLLILAGWLNGLLVKVFLFFVS